MIAYPLLLVLGLVALRPDPQVDESEVSQTLRSDRPLEPGDPDPLEFDRIARGLSRFLRNENTDPPLTIAITGEWGSGKSSLMSLLQGDLKSRGFRPVWFNAWHHQQEEHLLASLLSTVRSDALPTWSRPMDRLWFSARLIWRRSRKYAGRLVMLGLVFSVSLGYVLQNPESVGQVASQVGSLINGLQKKAVTDPNKAQAESGQAPEADALAGGRARNLEPTTRGRAAPPNAVGMEKTSDEFNQIRLSPPQGPDDPAPSAPPMFESRLARDRKASASSDPSGVKLPAILALLGSGIGLAVSLWRGLTAFGLKPGTLLASMSNSVRVRDLSAQAGFRYQFSREFMDVTWALLPRTLVLLIDDLDRCQPKQVMQMLQTVNFLVSSGQCIVVMGMAKARVIRCIAHDIEDVTEDADAPATNNGHGNASSASSVAILSGGFEPAQPSVARLRERREEFARNYLEKIINIEVPIPRPTDKQARRLLATDEDAAERIL